MKKIFLVFLVLCFAAVSYAGERNVYEMFKEKPHIKVYLKEVTSETENPDIKISEFKRIFDDVHRKRIGIKFVPVESGDEADVIVTANIERYVFTKKVAPSLFGVAALVADTLAPKSSAKLVVDYKVTDPMTGKLITEFKDFTTDARRPVKNMEEGSKAFEFAAMKNINRFIYKTFCEQKTKAHHVMD